MTTPFDGLNTVESNYDSVHTQPLMRHIQRMYYRRHTHNLKDECFI